MGDTTSLEELRRLYRQHTQLTAWRAVLGDESGVIYEPGRPGYYRVRLRQADGFTTHKVVQNRGVVNMQPGVSVWVAHDPVDGELVIRGPDTLGEFERGVDPAIHNPADAYAYGYMDMDRVGILHSESMSTPATNSTSVAVHSFFYLSNGTWHLFNGDDIDLSGDVPGAGNHLLSLIVLEEDDTLGSYTSTAQATAGDLDLTDIQEAWEAAPQGAIPISFWRLYGGQVRVDNVDKFIDGRQFVTRHVGLHADHILTDDDGDVLSDDNGNILTEF